MCTGLTVNQIAAAIKDVRCLIGHLTATVKKIASLCVDILAAFAEAIAARAGDLLDLVPGFFAGVRCEKESQGGANGDTGEEPDYVVGGFTCHMFSFYG